MAGNVNVAKFNDQRQIIHFKQYAPAVPINLSFIVDKTFKHIVFYYTNGSIQSDFLITILDKFGGTLKQFNLWSGDNVFNLDPYLGQKIFYEIPLEANTVTVHGVGAGPNNINFFMYYEDLSGYLIVRNQQLLANPAHAASANVLWGGLTLKKAVLVIRYTNDNPVTINLSIIANGMTRVVPLRGPDILGGAHDDGIRVLKFSIDNEVFESGEVFNNDNVETEWDEFCHIFPQTISVSCAAVPPLPITIQTTLYGEIK